MNKCIFIGNLTKDVESQTTSNGVSVSRFTVAVNRNYANANGERETDFINIVAWRGLGENCAKHLKKGSKVCVVGQMQNRSWEDNNGVKHYAVDIMAEDVEFLSSKQTTEETTKTAVKPNTATKNGLQEVDGAELPF